MFLPHPHNLSMVFPNLQLTFSSCLQAQSLFLPWGASLWLSYSLSHHCSQLLYTSFALDAPAYFEFSQIFSFPFPSRQCFSLSLPDCLAHRWLVFPLQRSSRRWFHNQFNHWWVLQCYLDSPTDEMWKSNVRDAPSAMGGLTASGLPPK